MDIAITLPKSLWDKIVSGEKSIELRKSRPSFYRLHIDKVYVVVKGSTEIVGYFYVNSFMATSPSCLMTCHNWLRQIAVSPEWISDYIEGANLVYLWFIWKVVSFEKPLSRTFDIKLNHNPQNYVYLK